MTVNRHKVEQLDDHDIQAGPPEDHGPATTDPRRPATASSLLRNLTTDPRPRAREEVWARFVRRPAAPPTGATPRSSGQGPAPVSASGPAPANVEPDSVPGNGVPSAVHGEPAARPAGFRRRSGSI